MNDPMGAALDRYITGNYGEDQFIGECEFEAFVDSVCGACPIQADPMTCDWLEADESKCPIIAHAMIIANKQIHEEEVIWIKSILHCDKCPKKCNNEEIYNYADLRDEFYMEE
jgi:hypothetical protein